MKKLFSLLLAVSMLCASATATLATGQVLGPIEILPILQTEETPDNGANPDLLIENVSRGTSIPTALWDLDGNPYKWEIEGLRYRIYTNYLFKPNPSSGAMRVETNMDRDSPQGPTTYIVNLYTKSGTWVYTSTVNTGGTYYINYSNLNPDTQYYVNWEYDGGQGETLSGVGWVKWLY